MPLEDTPEKTEVDLEKPETWPDDIDSLAEIAVQNVEPNSGLTLGAESETKSVPATDKPAEDKPAEATPPKKPEGKAEPEKPKEGQATEADLDQLSAKDAVVKTPDGKHEIPFDVLKASRERTTQLEEENRRLQEQLSAGGDTTTSTSEEAPAAAEKPPAKVADVALSDEQKEEVEQVRGEYGDQMATLHENQLRTIALLEQDRNESQAIAERLNREDQMAAQDENVQIQTGINTSPQMVAWQAGGHTDDREMYERAVETHKALMEGNPEYAAMSWEERFASLPEKVMVMYGRKGTIAATTGTGASEQSKPKTDQDEVARKAEKEQARAEADTGPVTLSDVPFGEIPVADEMTRALENQTPAETQEYLNRLAASPEKFRQFLANVS